MAFCSENHLFRKAIPGSIGRRFLGKFRTLSAFPPRLRRGLDEGKAWWRWSPERTSRLKRDDVCGFIDVCLRGVFCFGRAVASVFFQENHQKHTPHDFSPFVFVFCQITDPQQRLQPICFSAMKCPCINKSHFQIKAGKM